MTKLLTVCVVILLAVTAFASYNWLDIAVSLDHARHEQEAVSERTNLLAEYVLASNPAAKRADVLRVVKQLGGGHILKEEDDRIELDGVTFRFDADQKLTKVDPTIYVY
jgi:hypothetical protein